MRSLSAWGDTQIGKDQDNRVVMGLELTKLIREKKIKSIATACLNSSIGFDFNEDTKVLRIAIKFCSPLDTFTKKEAYDRLNRAFDLYDPYQVFWRGTYTGDVNLIRKEIFNKVTLLFKNLCLAYLHNASAKDNNHLNITVYSRDWSDVPLIRRELLMYLETMVPSLERDKDFLPRADFGTTAEQRGRDMNVFLKAVADQEANVKKFTDKLAALKKELVISSPPSEQDSVGPAND